MKDLETASAILARLCKARLADSEWPLHGAVDAFVGHRLRTPRRGNTGKSPGRAWHPSVGRLSLGHAMPARGFRNLERRLETLRTSAPELGRRATCAYFQSLGQAKLKSKALHSIKRYRAALREHTQCWGAIGYALIAIGHHHDAAEWMSDWADRPDVEGWMLNNQMHALRATGNDLEARRVSRFALTLPRHFATDSHELWLILDDLLAGPCAGASERLDHLDRANLGHADDKFLLTLAHFLAQVREATPETRRGAVASATRALDAIGRSSPIPRDLYRVLRGCYHRAIDLIAREKAGLRGKFWWLRRRLRPPTL